MESQPDTQVLSGPAKATPALPGEQVAFKEFETPWNLAGSGRGMAHLAPGAGDNFRAFSISEGLLRYLIPLAGSFHWLAGRASFRSSGSETLGLGFSLARPSKGWGSHRDLQTGPGRRPSKSPTERVGPNPVGVGSWGPGWEGPAPQACPHQGSLTRGY